MRPDWKERLWLMVQCVSGWLHQLGRYLRLLRSEGAQVKTPQEIAAQLVEDSYGEYGFLGDQPFADMIAKALAAAREEGRKAGLEQAAAACLDVSDGLERQYNDSTNPNTAFWRMRGVAYGLASKIRGLLKT